MAINWTTDKHGKGIAFTNHDHLNPDGTWGMTSTLVNCFVCNKRPATFPMFPTTGDTTKAVPMCESCAWEAFEACTHESDTNEPTLPTEG
jgi:hypothetical protein